MDGRHAIRLRVDPDAEFDAWLEARAGAEIHSRARTCDSDRGETILAFSG